MRIPENSTTTSTEASPSPLRVCLWSPVPPPMGGIGRWTLRYQDAAPHCDLDLRIVNTAPPAGTFSERSRFSTGRVWVAGRALRDLAGVLRHHRPEACHITTTLFWATPRDALALAMCRTAKVPTVLHIRASTQIVAWREGLDPARRRFLDITLRLADVVLVLSKELADYLQREVPGIRIERIGNMVSLEEQSDAREEAGPVVLPERRATTRVIFVGALTPLKGVAELCEAISSLEDVELALVGAQGYAIDDDASQRQERAMANLRATGRLIETGALSPSDVTQAYREADIFCLPSHREGLPNVLLEAMAAGLPCIATDVGAIPDVLEGECGVIIPVDDPDALRKAIQNLAYDSNLRAALRERAVERIGERYSVDAVMRAYRNIYTSLHDQAGGK